ncbi:MAG TPA: glycosyltransferase [Kiritimatiellia bacterium]|nr:glycosyltransferase [Kiritimatiellia bacterium]
MNIGEIRNEKFVIFSHYATTGACEELRDWLVANRAREVVYVAFPFGRDLCRPICVERDCDGGRVSGHRSWFRWKLPEPFAYAKDFLYAFIYAVRFGRGADVLVAGDNLLAAAALAARGLAGVRRVVYYMIDFTPVRFANRFLNGCYDAIDRFAATRADAVWPLTPQIIQGRFKAGRLDERRVKWYTVPYGSHPLAESDTAACDRRQVIYLGDVVRNKGAELFVPMVLALKRSMPDVRLTVIGGGKDLEALQAEVRAAGLEAQVDVCGFIERIEDALARLAGAGVAIAPYYPHDANSFTFFADPGKIKLYLGCGLPVVLTDVPPIAQELVREGAGRIARYDAEDFAREVASILTGETYAQMRGHARRLGLRYAWPEVFKAAFDRLT